MSCQIRINNNVFEVTDLTGKVSELYNKSVKYVNRLFDKFPPVQTTPPEEDKFNRQKSALQIWATAYTPEFLNRMGDWIKQGKKEPSLPSVLRYMNSLGIPALTNKDLSDIMDMMGALGVDNINDLQKEFRNVFYPNGYFDVNASALNKSKLYNKAEKDAILRSPKIQNDINKFYHKLAAAQNRAGEKAFQQLTNDILKSLKDVTPDASKILPSGKFKNINQKLVDGAIADKVAGVVDRAEFNRRIQEVPYEAVVERFNKNKDFAEGIFNKYSKMSKIPRLRQTPNGIQSQTKANTSVKLTNTLRTQEMVQGVKDTRDTIRQTPENLWKQEPTLVKGALKRLENQALQLNIDAIGLSETYDTKPMEEVKAFTDHLADFIQLVDSNIAQQEDIESFATVLDEYLGNDTSDAYGYREVEQRLKRLTLKELDTNENEPSVFESDGLLRVGDNLYHKVRKIPYEQLYEQAYDVVMENFTVLPVQAYSPSAFTSGKFDMRKFRNPANRQAIQDDIRRFVIRKTSEYSEAVSQEQLPLVEQIVLHRMLFGHPINPPVKTLTPQNTQEELVKMATFKGNYQYLTDDFISDFWNYVLQNKSQNTDLYQDVLQFFDVTQEGIVVEDGNIQLQQALLYTYNQDLMIQNLLEYAKISKHQGIRNLPILDTTIEATHSLDFQRTYYANNPSFVPALKTSYQEISPMTIIAKSNEDFVRTNEGVYQRVGQIEGVSVYNSFPIIENAYFNNYSDVVPIVEEFDAVQVSNQITTNDKQNPLEQTNLFSKSEFNSINEQFDECYS